MGLTRMLGTALGAALVLSGIGSLFVINQLPGSVGAIELFDAADDQAIRRDEDDGAPLVAVDDDDVLGDGDRTRGNDGTGGGNNTGDGDRTRGNDGTGGGNNTRVASRSGGGSRGSRG
jgi:hypothetical protein